MMSADGMVAAGDEAYLEEQALMEEAGSVEIVYDQEEAVSVEVNSQSNEIVFVDTSVKDYEKLVEDLQKAAEDGRNLEIVLVDIESDGISQITEALSKYNDLDAVHIYSHGSDGQIRLGDAWLDQATLSQNAEAISAWGNALSEDADILIFGCDLASTAEGELFVDALAQLTGADITASDDLTGSEALGGDWVLEYAHGQIEAETLIDQDTALSWQGLLAPPTAADNTVTTNEDTTYTFTAANFNYSDPDTDPMASVKITTLETVGSLQLSGVDVTLNQVITKADIDAGNLKFVPVADANGAGYDNFGFSVNDGTVDSVSTYTMTVNVAAVNDVPSYLGGDGIVITDISSDYNENANSTIIQTDGKIIVAGSAYNGSTGEFALMRYNSDGALDTSFGGGDGIVTTTIGSYGSGASAVTLQSDGKILLTGRTNNGSNEDLALVRYNSDGTLDTSFGGGDGIVTTDIGSNRNWGYSVVVQADGKIVVSGISRSGSYWNYALLRYNSDGTLDTGFGGGDGIVTTDFTSRNDSGLSVALQTDGKIVVGGYSDTGSTASSRNFAVARYNTDGSLDTGFGGGDGKVTTPIGSGEDVAYSITLQSDGKILAFGWSHNGSNLDLALVRYDTDGTLDTTFGGGDGKVTTGIGPTADIGYDVAVQSDGKIVVTGRTFNGSDFDLFVARYETDGTLDTSFGGGDGIVTTDVSGNDEGFSISVQTDGKIVVAGNTNAHDAGNDTDIVLVRYNSDGTLDTTFDMFDMMNSLDGAPTFIKNGAAVALDNNVNITDVELDALNSGLGNYDGASLTLVRNSSASVEDVFSFSNGSGITLSGGNLIKNSLIIATFDTTTTPGQLVITFTDANGETPTSADADNIMRQITYANSSGTPPASVQIDWVFDDGNTGSQGTGGALQALGSTTVSIDEAPTAANNTVTTNEDTTYTFTAADFNYSDPDSDPMASVKITALETVGSLQLSGANVTLDQVITKADIDAGNLKFVPVGDTNGASYDNFGFSVNDGIIDSLSTYTMTVDVAAVNDTPTFTVGGNEFVAHTITTGAVGAYSVTTADVDGDGDLDVLSASIYDNTIAWYENDGNGSFTSHTITTGANGAASVTTADVDGDGDLDVLSASAFDSKIVWYENDGNENFTARTITTRAAGAVSVTTADVDGDGDLDVLSASMFDNTIAWYENDGSENFAAHTITTSASQAYSVTTADVDGDGDIDVLSASALDDKIAWYENDGSGNFTAHTITTSADGAMSVTTADMDGDGDLDVLSASMVDDKIAWYENDGSGNFISHSITTSADGAVSVSTADVDGDGDLDVLSASLNDDKIAWYENDGNENFTAHTIATSANDPYSVTAADVDGDGDLDVLSASFNDSKIAWYENMSVFFTEGGAAVALDAGADVSDVELDALNSSNGDYDGASVTLVRNGGADSEDVFSFSDGNGITLSGSNLIKNSQIIATFDTTTTPVQLVITFTNANGEIPTSADVDNIMSQIAYANSSDAPPTSVQIDWVFDDGNTGSQGSGGALQALGSTTVRIIAVNDAPTAVNNTVTTTEDTTYTFASADFNYSDPDGDPMASVKITTLETVGSLQLSGADVTLDQVITKADIDAGNLKFVPVSDANGTGYDSFGFSVNDGVADSVSTYSMTIDVVAVNDAPVIGDYAIAGVFTDEGEVVAGSAMNILLGDIDGDGDEDMLIDDGSGIVVYTNDGIGGFTQGQFIGGDPFSGTLGDIDGDNDLDLLIGTMSETKIYLNDGGGTFSDSGQGLVSNLPYSIELGDVNNDGQQDVIIANILGPVRVFMNNNMIFTDSGQQLGAFVYGSYMQNYDVDLGDIDGDGDLDMAVGTAFDDFVYFNDGSGLFTNGQVLQPPDNGDNTIDLEFGDLDGDGDLDLVATYMFSQNQIYFNDGDGGFDTVQSLGTDVDTASTGVALADVNGDGALDIVIANANFEGKNPENHLYLNLNDGTGNMGVAQVLGNGSNAGDGVVIGDVNNDGALDILFTGPAGNNQLFLNSVTLTPIATLPDLYFTEGDPSQLLTSGRDVFDIDSVDFDGGNLTVGFGTSGTNGDQLSISHDGTGSGQIGLDGSTVSYEGTVIGIVNVTNNGADGNILQIDLNSNATATSVGALINRLTYQNTSDNPSATQNLSITVNDGDGVNSTSNTVTQLINITAVNDAPTAADNTVTTNEDTTYTFSASDFNYSDVEGDPLASVKITTLETVGSLQLSGVDVILNQVITKADIDAGSLEFVPVSDESDTGYDSFGFSVNDGTTDSASTYTMTVGVTAVNDAPTASDNTVTTNEDTTYTFSASDFNYSDIEGDTMASVKITTLETAGSLQLSGVDVTLNQVITKADIDAGNLKFVPVGDANGAGYDSFAFSVNDGTDDSASTYTMTVDVTAVNDSPIPFMIPGDLPGSDGPDEPDYQGEPDGPEDDVAPEDSGISYDGGMVDIFDETSVLVIDDNNMIVKLTGVESSGNINITGNKNHGKVGEVVEENPQLERLKEEFHASESELKALQQSNQELDSSVERVRDYMKSFEEEVIITNPIIGATLSLTVGLATWVLRGGSIITSLFMSMPLWKRFDPLPLLTLSRKKRREKINELKKVKEQESKENKAVADLLDNDKKGISQKEKKPEKTEKSINVKGGEGL